MTGNEYGTFLRQFKERGGQDLMLKMLRLMVQKVLEEGITRHLGADRHERSESRRGYRNGYKTRTLKTQMNELSLSVSQVRGTDPFEPHPLVKWQSSERAFLVACAEMYFQDVLTCKVSQVVSEMGDFELSAATVPHHYKRGRNRHVYEKEKATRRREKPRLWRSPEIGSCPRVHGRCRPEKFR